MRKGIWGGVICGTALQTVVLIIALYRTTWNKGITPGLNLDMESLHATSKSLFMTPILLLKKYGEITGRIVNFFYILLSFFNFSIKFTWNHFFIFKTQLCM